MQSVVRIPTRPTVASYQYIHARPAETTEVLIRRFTGVGDPEWTYDVRPIAFAAPLPSTWPYTQRDFERADEQPDINFYIQPRLVYHVDEDAATALLRYYDDAIPDGSAILDLCSSWTSHFPFDFAQRMSSIVGVGISASELACNDQLSRAVEQDLNAEPSLPFPAATFDVITCSLSMDYMTRPRELLREARRVLRPQGKLIIAQSDRCFLKKAVNVWTRDLSDEAHLRVLGTYISAAGGFDRPTAFDISARGPGTKNPMFIVTALRT